MACSETENPAIFAEALRANQNDRSRLAAILNCPKAMGLIATLDLASLNLVNQNAIREALKNKGDEIQYGYLQVDNDRTLPKCIEKLRNLSNDLICSSPQCNKAEIENLAVRFSDGKPCSHFFMKDRIKGMIDAIVATRFNGNQTADRNVILSDIRTILDSAPVNPLNVEYSKWTDASSYAARQNIEKLVGSANAADPAISAISVSSGATNQIPSNGPPNSNGLTPPTNVNGATGSLSQQPESQPQQLIRLRSPKWPEIK